MDQYGANPLAHRSTDDAFTKISDAICGDGFEGLPVDQGRTANEEQDAPKDINVDDLEGAA